MKFEKIFDKKLIDFLDKYSELSQTTGTDISNSIKKSQSSEIIIPVLGMQGMGKSTLINGLLRENILPNDADETTCVPVEVKYGADKCAIVHFVGKKDIVKVHTREELNEYVDNNYNPANKKHVSNIELFRPIEMLRGGLVVVDLPGVGSMTKENENTTKRYVENLCSAIFVIPTVPTIRNKEALFIKSLWSQFSKAIFVQNDWGESKQEKEESIEFNKIVLAKVAKELNNPFDNEIIVVNAYDAIYGALHNDESMVKSSNINLLRSKIGELADNWEGSKEQVLNARIMMAIQSAIALLNRRISAAGKSKEKVELENKQIILDFEKETGNISDKANKLRGFLIAKQDEVYAEAKKQSQDCASKIRAELFHVVDKGVFDGPRLSEAFEHIQDENCKDFTDSMIDYFLDIKNQVEESFSEIQQIELESHINYSNQQISLNSKLKWEKGFQLLANVGGGAVGFAGAGPLLAACGVAGPAAPIVAAVGVAIYGLFSLFGWGVKRITESYRADATKKQLKPKISEIENLLYKAMVEKYDELVKEYNKALDGIMSSRNDEFEKLKASLSNPDNTAIEELQKDLDYITDKEKEFENV